MFQRKPARQPTPQVSALHSPHTAPMALSTTPSTTIFIVYILSSRMSILRAVLTDQTNNICITFTVFFVFNFMTCTVTVITTPAGKSEPQPAVNALRFGQNRLWISSRQEPAATITSESIVDQAVS